MPFTHTESAGGYTVTETELTILAERGHLQGAMFGPCTSGAPSNSIYAEIYLATKEPQTPQNIALLASGMVGEDSNLGWTGNITLGPTYIVRALFWQRNTTKMRLTILTDVPPLEAKPK